jgi:hypothetical protein
MSRSQNSRWGSASDRKVYKMVSAQHSSESVEWYTPPEIMKPIRKYLGRGFFDPASCEEANEFVRAGKFFTAEQDGLKKVWPALNTFVNPPGGVRSSSTKYPTRSTAAAWALKLQRHWDKGEIERAIFLGFNIEIMLTAQSLAIQPDILCVVKSRIRFLEPGGYRNTSPTHGNVIMGWGDKEEFVKNFSKLGNCYIPFTV